MVAAELVDRLWANNEASVRRSELTEGWQWPATWLAGGMVREFMAVAKESLVPTEMPVMDESAEGAGWRGAC